MRKLSSHSMLAFIFATQMFALQGCVYRDYDKILIHEHICKDGSTVILKINLDEDNLHIKGLE